MKRKFNNGSNNVEEAKEPARDTREWGMNEFEVFVMSFLACNRLIWPGAKGGPSPIRQW